MGVKTVVGVYDPKEEIELHTFPAGVPMRTRDELDAVQRELQEVPGVSAILYIQTCAAEKRRRRKRGQFPDPDRRVFINPEVCEGCGDCGVQSNCVSILPLETEFGRKRGDRPVVLQQGLLLPGRVLPELRDARGREGPQGGAARSWRCPTCRRRSCRRSTRTWNVVVTGVGGTGVVTVGALLAMAARLEGKGAGVMEMAGLAQKGGAVHIHCRIAARPSDISAIRVAVGEADALIGGDLVVAAGAKTLGLTTRGRTRAVVNAHEIITGDFTRDRELPAADRPADAGAAGAARRGGARHARRHAAGRAADGRRDLRQRGDARRGLAGGAGAARARRRSCAPSSSTGRASRATSAPSRSGAGRSPSRRTPRRPSRRRRRRRRTTSTRSSRGARRIWRSTRTRRWRGATATGSRAARAVDPEFGAGGGEGLPQAPRLQGRVRGRPAACRDAAGGGRRPSSPACAPCASTSRRRSSARRDAAGHPRKSEFGPWMMRVFGLLARAEAPARDRARPVRLLGGAAHGAGADRGIRARHGPGAARASTPATREIAIALAALPLEIRGFGHVKAAAAEAAARRREELLAAFAAGGWPQVRAAE